ncbi:hypothetical protein LOZ66_006802 [Ophidiomyces ophidiicola]|nr:hypothetical protein LOZ66_006802 [Ophidiomyces ophidiicola]
MEKLMNNHNGSEERTDSCVPEFLQHKQYETEWRGKRVIFFGIKLLVTEKMFGSYQLLFDIIEMLSSNSGVHRELGEKIKCHELLILRIQQFYNDGFCQMSCTMVVNLWLLQQIGKVDELHNALELSAMVLPVAVDNRTVNASNSQDNHAIRCPKSNKPTVLTLCLGKQQCVSKSAIQGTVQGALQTQIWQSDERFTLNCHQQSSASGSHLTDQWHLINHDNPSLSSQDACDSINEQSNEPMSISLGNGLQLSLIYLVYMGRGIIVVPRRHL